MSSATESLEIRADVLYKVSAVKRLMDVGPWGWSSLLAAGLKTVRIGNHHWCRGSELLSAIDRMQHSKEPEREDA